MSKPTTLQVILIVSRKLLPKFSAACWCSSRPAIPANSLPSWQTHVALGLPPAATSWADLPIRLLKLPRSVAAADPGVARSTAPSSARLPVIACQGNILRDAIAHLLRFSPQGGLDCQAFTPA